jgi:hypothetical protein
MKLCKGWFRKKIIIRRPISPANLPPGFRWMGRRSSRIFFVSAIVMLGMLTFFDSLLGNAGFRGHDIRLFDDGIIGSFGMVWLVLYYVKPDWFMD